MVKYLTATHNIFICHFMDKRVQLVLDPNDTYATTKAVWVAIDDEFAYMQKQLKYFDDWRQENLSGKRPSTEFLDDRTYKNLRTGVAGFLYYAKAVLSLPKEEAPEMVHFLDSNSSGIENLFCQVRVSDRDTPDGFAKGVAAVSLNDQEHKVRGESKRTVMFFSSSYGGDHQADDRGGMMLSGDQVLKRDSDFEALVASRGGRTAQLNLQRASKTLQGKSTRYESFLRGLFEKNPLSCHFSDTLLCDEDITELAKVSPFGPSGSFFWKVFGLLTAEEEDEFDLLCQKLNEHLIACFGACMEKFDKSKSKKKVTFNESLVKLLQSQPFVDLVVSSPVQEFHCHAGLCAIAQSLWSTLLKLVRDCLPNKIVDSLHAADRKVNFKVEVNSFFGWAISQVHRALLDDLLAAEDEGSESRAQEMLDFVSAMRYFDHQAALDEAYLRDCYDGIYRLTNCGGLTLVAPRYFEFGKSLMQVIVNALSMEDFDQYGSDAVQHGWAHVNQNMESLKSQFLECHKEYTAIDVSAKLTILQRLVEKTRNARFGVEVNARSEKTKRGGKNYVGMTHRGQLKGSKVGSRVNKELKMTVKEDD